MDEQPTDDFYDEQARRLHDDPLQECIPGCWVCASKRYAVSDYMGPLVSVRRLGP